MKRENGLAFVTEEELAACRAGEAGHMGGNVKLPQTVELKSPSQPVELAPPAEATLLCKPTQRL
jgi:hypothetical protein